MVDRLAEKFSERKKAANRLCLALTIAAQREPNNAKRQELYALIQRIHLCNHPENLWKATGAINYDTGEEYTASGTFWNCGSKLCSNCLAERSRRNRKRLREAINSVEFLPREKLKFLTFTISNPGLDLLATREIINRAWALFRKRKLCVSLFRGGSKSEEFTVTENGFHYHLHVLVISKWFLYQELRRVWTECVEKAFADAKVPFEVNTKDGLLICKFKDVTSTERSIQEVCKYVTKSDSWVKMHVQSLTDVALVRRWFRMFELFGCLSDRQSVREERESIVHTSSLSDGESPSPRRYWRDFVNQFDDLQYLTELRIEFAEAKQYRLEQLRRRWPEAIIDRLELPD